MFKQLGKFFTALYKTPGKELSILYALFVMKYWRWIIMFFLILLAFLAYTKPGSPIL